MGLAGSEGVWDFSFPVEGIVVASNLPACPAPAIKPKTPTKVKSTLTTGAVRPG
jgi:hypothetical protein